MSLILKNKKGKVIEKCGYEEERCETSSIIDKKGRDIRIRT